jgi:hypothetical protein
VATFRQVDAAFSEVYTKPPSPKPWRDTGLMVHPPGGMLEVGKASQNQFRIGFSSFMHVLQAFQQQPLFEMIANVDGDRVPRRPYVECCLGDISVEKTLHTYPLDASTSPGRFGMNHGA